MTLSNLELKLGETEIQRLRGLSGAALGNAIGAHKLTAQERIALADVLKKPASPEVGAPASQDAKRQNATPENLQWLRYMEQLSDSDFASQRAELRAMFSDLGGKRGADVGSGFDRHSEIRRLREMILQLDAEKKYADAGILQARVFALSSLEEIANG